MGEPQVFIEYKNKKNSSGRIIDGNIYLAISERLEQEEKERHIKRLKERLLQKLDWANQYKFPRKNGIVKNDQELFDLAVTINKAYYNFSLEKVLFHTQYSTWGTCSTKKKSIYISHRLCDAPMEIVWYVLVHEICHLAEPSHNKNFWKLVSRGCPDYSECRKKLNAYGYRLG